MSVSLPPGFSHPVELARGSTGVVYRVRQEGLERFVALKVVSAADRKLVEFEARRLASLALPCLPTVHGVFHHKGRSFLVEEWIRGMPLLALLETGIPLFQEECLAFALCRAVATLHQAGLAHGDLKPANVVCSVQGDVRLLDLGLARQAGDGAQAGGTPAYLAPELKAGQPHPQPEMADLWALGILVHEILCGVRPTEAELEKGLSRLAHDRNPRVLAAVEGLLRRRPEERWTAQAAAEALESRETQASHQELEMWVERLFRRQLAGALHQAALAALHRKDPRAAFAFVEEALEHDSDHVAAMELLPRIRFGTPRFRWRRWLAVGIGAGLLLLGLGTGWLLGGHTARKIPVPLPVALPTERLELPEEGRIKPGIMPDLPLREAGASGGPRATVVFEGFPPGAQVQLGGVALRLGGGELRPQLLPPGRHRLQVVWKRNLLCDRLLDLAPYQELVVRPGPLERKGDE